VSLLAEVIRRLRSFVLAPHEDRELDEEIRFHIEKEVEKNVARGMSPQEARRQAHIKFGGVERMKERTREARGLGIIDDLSRDTAYALRRLRRDRVFTIGVVLLLGIGIGANVGVFSIVHGVLLRPLPYSDSERLVAIREAVPQLIDGTVPVNERHFLEWQACQCFADIAMSNNFSEANITGEQDPERVPLSRVTPNTFDLLGVRAQIGRTFLPEDGQAGADQIVVLSDGLWRRRFGADPAIIGSTIGLNGTNATVIGVLPPGFRHYDRSRMAPDGRVDVYVPWVVSPASGVAWFGTFNYEVIARLREGVSLDVTRQEINAIQASIAERFDPQFSSYELRAELTPLRESLTGQSRSGLLLLLGAVGAALLVACLNVANLMLVRARRSAGAAALRTALGSPRAAIFRGAMVESVVLALLGCAVGIAVAAALLRGFAAVAPAGLPRADEVGFDSTAVLVGLALSLAVTLIFGVVPALRTSRADPQDALRANARGISGSLGWAGQGLVSMEVGLSAGLLVVAGLLTMSFARLQVVDRGYDAGNVLTAELTLPAATYGPASRREADNAHERFWDQLIERLESDPGVVAAGVTSMLPLRGDNWADGARPAGDEGPLPEELPAVQYRWVSPNYWAAMGAPMLRGRPFDADDRAQRVAVLSFLTANTLWPGADPIGRYFYRGDPDELYEVVGVVSDVHTIDLADEPVPMVYLPLWLPGAPVTSVSIRTLGDPTIAVTTLRDAVRSLDAQLAVSDVQTMAQIDRDVLGERRFGLLLVAAFAIASLLIAALGTYSVLAYAVNSRMHEIAIRLSLGAEPGRIKAMVVGQGLRAVLVGLVLGIAAAFVVGRSLSSLLYAVSPSDPVPFALVALVILGAATAASWIPATRAASVSSSAVLRQP
jgi:putative ABC transport system permease protein